MQNASFKMQTSQELANSYVLKVAETSKSIFLTSPPIKTPFGTFADYGLAAM